MRYFRALIVLIVSLSFAPVIAQQTPTTPEPRAGHELVWDAYLEMVVLVNGDHDATDNPARLWGWDGETWQILGEDAPPSQTLGGVAYDAENHQLVLHGSSQSLESVNEDTWLWDGETWQTWAGENPGRRDHFSMVATPAGIVLYAGQDVANNAFFTDTWLWDGEGWTQVATEGPSRYHYAYAYDSARDQVLLFGGVGPFGDKNDLWAWDGTSWEQIDTGIGPSVRVGARMAFDETNEVMVLFGGFTSRGSADDTWLWDGETWTRYESTVNPHARGLQAMAYDPLREKIVMFGGYDEANLGDTWEWDMANGWVEVGVADE